MTRAFSGIALLLLIGLAMPPVALAEESPPSTDLQWITYGSNVTQLATGMRVVRHQWFAQAGIGGLSAFDNRENAFFWELNVGRRFPLGSWLRLGLDVGYRHVMPDGSDNPAIDTSKYFTLEARLMLEAVLGRHMSLFVGGGATSIYRGNSLGDETDGKGSVFWGVGLL